MTWGLLASFRAAPSFPSSHRKQLEIHHSRPHYSPLQPTVPAPRTLTTSPIMKRSPQIITTPSHTTLLDLPNCLLFQIAGYLSPVSALALAHTHSNLRLAGEAAAWSEINISMQRSHLLHQPSAAQPIGLRKLYEIIKLRSWESPVEYTQALERYFLDLEMQLVGHSNRRKAVRSIIIDIDTFLLFRFAEILNLVAPTLQSLEFITLAISGLVTALTRPPFYPNVRQLFESTLHLHLPRLKKLALPLDEYWDETIRTVLRCTPNLERLELCSEQPFSGGWAEHTIFRPAQVDGLWPVLPLLRELEARDVSDVIMPMLAALVRFAPRLNRVSLHDVSRAARFDDAAGFFDALAQCKELRYFSGPKHCMAFLARNDLPGLEEVSLNEFLRPWGHAQLEVSPTISPKLHTDMCVSGNHHPACAEYETPSFTRSVVGSRTISCLGLASRFMGITTPSSAHPARHAQSDTCGEGVTVDTAVRQSGGRNGLTCLGKPNGDFGVPIRV